MPLDAAAKLAAHRHRRLLRVAFPDLRRADMREMWTARNQEEREAQMLRLELPAWIRPAALRRLRRRQRSTPVEAQMLGEIHEQRQQTALRDYLTDLDGRIDHELAMYAFDASDGGRGDYCTSERERLEDERDEFEQEREAAARRSPNKRPRTVTPRGCAGRAPRRTGARSRGRRFRPVRRSSASSGDSDDGESEPAKG